MKNLKEEKEFQDIVSIMEPEVVYSIQYSQKEEESKRKYLSILMSLRKEWQ
jgi:hypothetical protein